MLKSFSVKALTFAGLTWVASGMGQTAYQMANGVVRHSRFQGANEAYLPVIANSSHGANLLTLPNGDLLCFWYAGTWERKSGVSIAMSRLKRGSRRWSEPVIVSNRPDSADQNPVAFRAPDGRLWLFHTGQKRGEDETKAMVYALTSDDQGYTWSAPRSFFPDVGIYIRQPLVVFQQKWLFPIYRPAGNNITSHAEKDHSYVEISKDNGATWEECDVPGSDGLVQMNIIKMSEDRLVAFFRSRYADWIYQSDSTDGCHWSAPAATKLPNNNSSIQAARLTDGHLVMALNNAQATTERGKPLTAARRILSVGLSIDGGKTWPWVRDVQAGNTPPPFLPSEDPEYSYPSVTQSPDGRIDLAFTFRRETIKYMSFDEQWIKQGGTSGGRPEEIRPEAVAFLKHFFPEQP